MMLTGRKKQTSAVQATKSLVVEAGDPLPSSPLDTEPSTLLEDESQTLGSAAGAPGVSLSLSLVCGRKPPAWAVLGRSVLV